MFPKARNPREEWDERSDTGEKKGSSKKKVWGSDGKISAVGATGVVARCNGRTDTGFGVDPCGNDGYGRSV